MARRKAAVPVPSQQAREARAVLLSRAQWIVDNSVRAACGYNPQLPPDLIDFTNQPGLPNQQILSALLKAVMPVITLEDDIRPSTLEVFDKGLKAHEQIEYILNAVEDGHTSMKDAEVKLEMVIYAQEARNRHETREMMRSMLERKPGI